MVAEETRQGIERVGAMKRAQAPTRQSWQPAGREQGSATTFRGPVSIRIAGR